MSAIEVRIVKGRETFSITCPPNATFGTLRAQVETRCGAVQNGLRLIHKGTTPPDTATLSSAGVVFGAKMLALATATQRAADLRAAKKEKATEDAGAMDAMRERQRAKEGSSAEVSAGPNASGGKRMMRGDAEVDGQTCVIIAKGHDRFRINIALSSTVLELKSRAEGLEGINARARDMKMIFKAGVLRDDALLSACGVKDGSAVMVMFTARHHDVVEAREELDRIEKELGELEGRVEGCVKKAQRRLLEGEDLMLAKGEVAEVCGRLTDNVRSVQGEEERKAKVQKAVDKVAENIEELAKWL